jgi:STE24 endopeptidase
MQLFLLALVLALLAHDAMPARPDAVAGTVGMLALWLGPKLLLAAGYWGFCQFVQRSLTTGRAEQALSRLDRVTAVHRLALLGLFGLDLWNGVLTWLRQTLGDFVLVDELLLMLPTLAVVVAGWAAYYPIDRRLREAKLVRDADAGRPIYPIWSRGQFLLAQLRHQIALLLVPLLLLLGWLETVAFLAGPRWLGLMPSVQMVLALGGAAGVFVLAPVIIRHVWDTAPLPDGAIRDRLTRLCQQHRIKVRELLLWRTYGGMINAAVMGLFAPLRYILLSDALLDQVPADQVEAVMAHEVAHVQRKHMVWLLMAAGGSIGLIQAGAWLWLKGMGAIGPHGLDPAALRGFFAGDGLGLLVLAGAALGWVALFGWVSRRFERQADAFAVVHLAQQSENPWRDGHGRLRVDPESAEVMVQALQKVAELNNVPAHRKSWRHGSIAWRQAHLRDMVGQPVETLPIDQQMRWIKRGSALAAAGAVAAMIVL